MTKRPTKVDLEAELRERRRVGNLMSSVIYNLAQLDTTESQIRRSCDSLRLAWDRIGMFRIAGKQL